MSDAVPHELLYGLRLSADETSEGWNVTATATFDVATLRAAIERVRNDATYQICPPNDRHCVHPAEWERGGLAVCGNCGAIVDLGPRGE